MDDDCDDTVDEDAGVDSYEEDDERDGGADLGDLTDETAKVSSWLNPEYDEDGFYFYVEDGYLDWFGIDLDLQVPSGLDLAFELWFYDNDWEMLEVIDDGGDGRNESYYYEGSGGSSDTGWYWVRIFSVDGASCEDDYTLNIEA